VVLSGSVRNILLYNYLNQEARVKKFTTGDHLRYRFDNFMSRGTIALVLALFAVTLLMILAAAMVIVIARLQTSDGTGPLGFGEALWQATMRTIDTGTVAGDTGWSFRESPSRSPLVGSSSSAP
jgi:hypothetical protein